MPPTKFILALLALTFLLFPSIDNNNGVYSGKESNGSKGTYVDNAPVKHYYQGGFENY